jgi:hypothetical protein
MTKAKFATHIPSAITMPDRVETRLGTLQFTDGFPDDATVEKVFDNLDFQLPEAYRKTSRYSVNLVISPTPRIDTGIEYIYGTRENFDGLSASADQVQFVGIFRF